MKHTGGITTLQAFKMYGVTRLASRIHDLRESGYEIETARVTRENRYGESCSVVRYSLKLEETITYELCIYQGADPKHKKTVQVTSVDDLKHAKMQLWSESTYSKSKPDYWMGVKKINQSKQTR